MGTSVTVSMINKAICARGYISHTIPGLLIGNWQLAILIAQGALLAQDCRQAPASFRQHKQRERKLLHLERV